MKLIPVKKVLITFLVIVVGVLIWASQNGNFFNQKQELISKEFTGTLEEYKDNIFTVAGIYTLDDNTEKQEVKNIEIIIGPDTKITRTVLILPTRTELEKTKGYFEADKLARSDSEVDLTTLQKDTEGMGMGIFAKSDQNILGLASFMATELNYRIVKRP